MLIEHSKYCWAWNRVYVKANGRVPCWCDSGESYTIIHNEFLNSDFIKDTVNSEQMRQMRLKVLSDNQYYIKECANCCCMIDKGKHHRFADIDNTDTIDKVNVALKMMNKVHQERGWPIGSIDKIMEIQLEPSFPCNLKCPGCLQGAHQNPMSTEPPPYIFPYEWFEHMVNSIIVNMVKLNRIAFVGRGEPTLNLQLPSMISHARKIIPKVIMSMDTNSNQQFKEEYLNLNWINCSVDGSNQESYARYRRNGKLSKALDFMRSAVEAKRRNNSNCIIKWKYILFDTNDTDQDLRTAQELANDIQVDELDLILTHCGSSDGSIAPSKRFGNLHDLNNYITSNKIFHTVVGLRAT